MTDLPRYVIASALITVIAVGFALTIAAVGRRFDRPFLRHWLYAWVALAGHASLSAVALLGASLTALGPVRAPASALSLFLAWMHMYFLHAGMWTLCRPGVAQPVWRRWLPALALGAAIVLVFAPYETAAIRYLLRVTLLSVTWGVVYLMTATLILRHAPQLSTLVRRALGGALALFGLFRLAEPLSYPLPTSALLDQIIIFSDVPFLVATGAGMLLALLEGEREELERREARFRSLIENLSDILFIITPDATLRYASPSVERVLGFAPEALIGTNAFEHIHPEEAPAVRDAMLRSFAQDETVPAVIPFRVRPVAGDWIRLEARSRPFLEADGTPRLIVTARDVREQHRLQSELLGARRLETVGRLAGGVAHDFNNLLTAILGNVSLLRGSVAIGTPARADLDEVERAAIRGADLTRRLLAFARRQMIEPRIVDLADQMRGLEPLIVRLLGAELVLRIESAGPIWPVRVDPTALEQAVVNLAVNARDAMPAGGRLTLRIENVTFDDAGHTSLGVPEGEWVRIDAEDTGTGIDEETLGQIFEPFFTTKGPTRGTGLGLATVHGIVSQAGGHVRVRSEPGAGSCFSLYFPRVPTVTAVPPAPVAAGASAAMPTARGDETVLLIEDEAPVRDVTARLLRELGYHVLSAADGTHGISVAASHAGPIHAIVSDLAMPHMGGTEAVARIRKRRPAVAAVFITGYSEDALAWRGDVPEGGRLLPKPFTTPELAQTVRAAIDASG